MSLNNYEKTAWANTVMNYDGDRDAIEMAADDFRTKSAVQIMDTEATEFISPCARDLYTGIVGDSLAQVAEEYYLSDNEMNTVIEITRDRVGR